MVRTFYLRVLGLSKWVVTKIIIGYQYFVSPFFPSSCRFEIGCSEYTKLAVIKYGIIKGLGCGVVRLFKCQPFFNYTQNSEDI